MSGLEAIGHAISLAGMVQNVEVTRKYLNSVTQSTTDRFEYLRDVTDDLEILSLVLQECERAFAHYSEVPLSAKAALKICRQRQISLMDLLQKGVPSAKPGLAHIKHLRFPSKEHLMSRSLSFREAVLLLRDLTADYNVRRIHEQSMELSLMASQENVRLGSMMDQSLGILRREFHDSEDDASHRETKEKQLVHHLHSGPDHQNKSNDAPPAEQIRRPGRNGKYKEFMQISQFDFTRDLILVLQVTDHPGTDQWEYVPVRNLVDTGSAENFVSRDLLERNGMDMKKVRPIDKEKRIPRTLKTLGNQEFIPTEEVELFWHRLNDRKQRRDIFIVLKTAEFDTLIGGKQFMEEEKVALPVVSAEVEDTWSFWRFNEGKKIKHTEDEAAEAAAHREIDRDYKALKE